jgi:SagB-type dehydrogenase family enzyme
MKNRDTEATWNYHDGTKHSYQSIRASRHYLDWENQPIPFKIYSKLEPIPLPEHLSSSRVPGLAAISAVTMRAEERLPLTSQSLAEILFLSAGVTKRKSYPGGEMLFRAAACTGALYHVDLYLVCGDLANVKAGVYHFSPHEFALRRLRAGDYRGVIARASAEEPAVVNAPCVIICASTYWRNAWKYQARAYRHCYWDNGTILANLLAAAAARNARARVVLGFVDETVNRLLDLDARREGSLSMVALGSALGGLGGSPPFEPLAFETVPLSKKELDYPAIRAMHEASSLESEGEVAAWRDVAEAGEGTRDEQGAKAERIFPLRPTSDEAIPQDTIEEVIRRRGSTRQFGREPITWAQLSTMLDRATRGIPADFLSAEAPSLNNIYVIVHAVEDLPAGAYFFNRQTRALELLKEGDFRREAGYLGLGQEIPADCSVNVYFLADLKRVLQRFGNRGYRAAQLEAAIMGGKLYLAAYSQRLGASGLTFFDDDVTEFFSPHAAGKSVMFLIALGRSAKARHGLAGA